MSQAPPSAQVMHPTSPSDQGPVDPKVDAAVRFCDEVVLASPTVALQPGSYTASQQRDCFGAKGPPMTYTVPIVNESGETVLSAVIQVPDYGKWGISVVTAEGVCVSRARRRPKSAPKADKDSPWFVDLEWGGRRFGQFGVDTSARRKFCLPALCGCRAIVNHVQGPTETLTHAHDLGNARNAMFDVGMSLLHAGVPIFCAALLCLSSDRQFKSRDDEVVAIERGQMLSPLCFYQRDTVLHFTGATTEQRRLALLSRLCEIAKEVAAQPDNGNVSTPVA